MHLCGFRFPPIRDPRANQGASREEALKAWRELKAMDAPKTYASWAEARRAREGRA